MTKQKHLFLIIARERRIPGIMPSATRGVSVVCRSGLSNLLMVN
jgi:hypothetical protein